MDTWMIFLEVGVLIALFVALIWWATRRRRLKDPMRATALVVQSSHPPEHASYSNVSMICVVTAPGLPATRVEHTDMLTPVAKWPYPGERLPVLIDRADLTRMRVLWKEVPSGREQGVAEADALAARMRLPSQGIPGDGGLSSSSSSVSVEVNGQRVSPEIMQKIAGAIDLEAILAGLSNGTHPDGGKTVIGNRVVMIHSGKDEAPESTVERLQKLEKVRAAGFLTDAEYEEARQRLIGAI